MRALPHQLGHSLKAGDRIDRYRIEAFIGAGGMGEVYRAIDGTLGRFVALKILPVDSFSEDRARRFLAEAQNASRLRHPAIVTVHDTGRTRTNGSSVYFLSMELVEGQTLSAPGQRRDPARTFELMAQVAEGLAAAHANGIIHRDLKPENIIVSRDGYAKILDFGISKLLDADGNGEHDRATDPSRILGTVGYMSPEQAAGREMDHRSDVFSFGAVLYELVSGRSPFEGPSPVDTLHNILHLQPPPPRGAPAELQRILRKCLAKDRDQRYDSMKDVALDLRELAGELRRAESTILAPTRQPRWALGAALLVMIAAAAGLWFSLRSRRTEANVTASSVKMSRLTYTGNVVGGAISPDGNYVVHAIRDKDRESLWVKQVATGSLFRLSEVPLVYYDRIRVSPDGNWVYFTSATRRDPNVWHVYQIPLLGGETRKVVDNIDGQFTISPDGKQIAFVRFDAVERVPKLFTADIESGSEMLLLQRKERFFGALSWNPDGKSIAFVSHPEKKITKADKDEQAQRRTIEQVQISDGSTRQLIPNRFGWVGALQWLPDGSGLVLTAADNDEPSQIWFVPYPTGEPKKLTSDIVGYNDPTVTHDGRFIVAGRMENSSNIWVVRPGASAQARALTTGTANLYGMDGGPVWTPDGTILFTSYIGHRCDLAAVAAPPAGGAEFAAMSPTGETVRRLTQGRHITHIRPSPTEARMVFLSDESGNVEVWIGNLDGSDARQLTREGETGFPSFFPDGRSIAYVAFDSERQFAYKRSLTDGTVRQLTDKPTNNTHVSPDGKWLLCRYRQPEPGKPLWRTALLSLERSEPIRFFETPRYGGSPRLRWLRDGSGFSFVDWKNGVANIWVQPIEGGQSRQITFFDSGDIYGFDWSPDGSHLVLSQGNPIRDAVLITNFQ